MFRQGEEAHSFFVLLHGHVRASKTTPAGQQIVVRYVAPGETFGVATAIGLTQYPATATAVDDSVVLAWPSAAWPRLVARHPSLAASTLQTVGSRLQETHARVIEMSTQQVERRVAHALLRLARQAGRKVEQGVEIDFPISRQDIAEMTGTTLHTVSRTSAPGSSRAWSRAAASASCCAIRIGCSSSPNRTTTDGHPAALRSAARKFSRSIAMLAAGVVDAWKPAIGQPTQLILKSRNTRMVAGQRRITSPTVVARSALRLLWRRPYESREDGDSLLPAQARAFPLRRRSGVTRTRTIPEARPPRTLLQRKEFRPRSAQSSGSN